MDAPFAAVVGLGVDLQNSHAVATLVALLPQTSRLSVVILSTPGSCKSSELRAALECAGRPVIAATAKSLLQPGCIYMVPTHSRAVVRTGRIELSPMRDQTEALIDRFLVSLAVDQMKRAIGIVLSVTPGHGHVGLTAISQAGGISIGPLLCQQGAVERPAALRKRFIERVPQRVLKHLTHLGVISEPCDGASEHEQVVVKRGRRPDGITSPLVANGAELCGLERVPQASRARVWIPDCGSDEELGALSRLFAEQQLRDGAPASMQIFVTDRSAAVIDALRTRTCSAAALVGLPGAAAPDAAEYPDLAVKHMLRRCGVFARHDPRDDPPFMNIGLLLGRQLLIQMPTFQHPAMFRHFYLSLRNDGWLWVGADYALSVPDMLFEAVNSAHGLFRARPNAPRFTYCDAEPPPPLPPAYSDLGARFERLGGFTQPHARDFSTWRNTDAELAEIMRAVPALAFGCDAMRCVTYVSPAFASEFGSFGVDSGTPLEDLVDSLPGGQQLVSIARAVQRHGDSRTAVWGTQINGEPRSYLVRAERHQPPRSGDLAFVLTDVTSLDDERSLAAQRERRQTLLADLAGLALQAADYDEPSDPHVFQLCRSALDALQETLHSSHAMILETQCQHDVLLLRATRGLELEQQAPWLTIPDGSTWHTALELQTASMLGIDDASTRDDTLLGRQLPTAGLVCPLRVGDSVVGLLTLYQQADDELGLDELHFVQAVANVVAAAISRQRVHRQLSLERRVALAALEADTFSELGSAMMSTFSQLLGDDVVELWLQAGSNGQRELQRVWPCDEAVLPLSAAAALDHITPLSAQRLMSCVGGSAPQLGATADSMEVTLPVIMGDNVLGALRLVRQSPRSLHPELVAGLEHATRTIASFMRRMPARDAEQHVWP